jgi:hypothetical protein
MLTSKIKRIINGRIITKDVDEKFPVGSKVRVNTQGSETMGVLRRDGTTVWTNKGVYHEDKLVVA